MNDSNFNSKMTPTVLDQAIRLSRLVVCEGIWEEKRKHNIPSSKSLYLFCVNYFQRYFTKFLLNGVKNEFTEITYRVGSMNSRFQFTRKTFSRPSGPFKFPTEILKLILYTIDNIENHRQEISTFHKRLFDSKANGYHFRFTA